MSKLKEISDELLLIAYADVQDRNSLLSDLSFKLANTPKSELSDNERVLIMEIIDGFMVESFLSKKEKDETPQKQAKSTKAKATKAVPVEPQPQVIEVVEPKVVVEEAPQVIVEEPEVVVPTPTPKAKPTPKVKPQPAKDLSFLDDIDDAF
jgi:outer membrane biosynthesis protein TonB